MNPWWLAATSIFDMFQKKNAEKKRRRKELEQIRIQDEIAKIQTEDTARYMGKVNLRDYIMRGETDPALWSTIAQYVNPIDHETQAQINADLYNTTIDTGDVTATPTGFVAEGYAPSAAAAATRVADASAARNELLGRNQAYLVQDPSLSTQASHTLGNIYNVRNLGGNLAQMMTAEDFEPTNVDDLNEQLVALGAPITAPINTTGILSGIANIQANNAMINALKT